MPFSKSSKANSNSSKGLLLEIKISRGKRPAEYNLAKLDNLANLANFGHLANIANLASLAYLANLAKLAK